MTTATIRESKWDKANRIQITIPQEGQFIGAIGKSEVVIDNPIPIGDVKKENIYHKVILDKDVKGYSKLYSEAYLDKFGLVISYK